MPVNYNALRPMQITERIQTPFQQQAQGMQMQQSRNALLDAQRAREMQAAKTQAYGQYFQDKPQYAETALSSPQAAMDLFKLDQGRSSGMTAQMKNAAFIKKLEGEAANGNPRAMAALNQFKAQVFKSQPIDLGAGFGTYNPLSGFSGVTAQKTIPLQQTPEYKAKVEKQKGIVKTEAADIEKAKLGKIAYNTFSSGLKSLADVMAQTETGIMMGNLPAVTPAQQKAEGALSTMAPLMKDVFRGAGEGVFTDSDQKIIMDMLPSRSDHQEVIKYKLKSIDSIVRNKLGINQPMMQAPQGTAPDLSNLTTEQLIQMRKSAK